MTWLSWWGWLWHCMSSQKRTCLFSLHAALAAKDQQPKSLTDPPALWQENWLSVPDLTATHTLSNSCPLRISLFDQCTRFCISYKWKRLLANVLGSIRKCVISSRFNDGIETEFFQLGWLIAWILKPGKKEKKKGELPYHERVWSKEPQLIGKNRLIAYISHGRKVFRIVDIAEDQTSIADILKAR